MEQMTYKIGFSQFPILFHNSLNDWKDHIEKWFMENKKKKSKLLVFPEYGSLDLISLNFKKSKGNLKKQLIEIQSFHEFFISTFKELSEKYSIYTLAPSFPVKIGKKFFNRAYFFSPSGNFDYQDKIHMTRFERDWGISESQTPLKIFKTEIGNIGVQICFDIEFAWPSSVLAKNGAHLILAPSCTESNFGLNRVHIGARARALENQIYVGVSQTIGTASWSPAVDINTGQSALYSTCDKFFPNDGVIKIGPLNASNLLIANVKIDNLKAVRKDGQVLNFKLNSFYPWENNSIKNLKPIQVTLK